MIRYVLAISLVVLLSVGAGCAKKTAQPAGTTGATNTATGTQGGTNSAKTNTPTSSTSTNGSSSATNSSSQSGSPDKKALEEQYNASSDAAKSVNESQQVEGNITTATSGVQ